MTETFEESAIPPPDGSRTSTPDGWVLVRDGGIAPLNESPLADSDVGRWEFMRGAELLGLVGRSKDLKPQQLRLADVCNMGRQTVAVLLPRRSAKTTSLFALALGRCAMRDEYLVGYTTCTTGQKARDRFIKDIAMVLKRLWPDEKTRGFRVLEGKGGERVVFDNGSIFQVGPPLGDTFRSDAYDLVIVDEAGEADPEMGEDLLGAILPTFDTRPDAQLIVAGTAPEYRVGNILWNTLEFGRDGDAKTGILEYAAPDSTTEEDLKDWAIVEQLALAAHPGIGTLTTLETIEDRWKKLTREQFAREYLSIAGNTSATSGIVNFEKFTAGALKGPKPAAPPARFVIGIAVHPFQTSSAIVAVWREKGKARVLVLDHQAGVQWLVPRTLDIARRTRAVVVHDTTGPVMVEAEALARARPRIKMAPQSFTNIKTAAALIVKEIEIGNVQHWNQTVLTEAARLATKRSVGKNAWALGRKNDEDDIVALEAASHALRVYDETEKRPALMPSEAAA